MLRIINLLLTVLLCDDLVAMLLVNLEYNFAVMFRAGIFFCEIIIVYIKRNRPCTHVAESICNTNAILIIRKYTLR